MDERKTRELKIFDKTDSARSKERLVKIPCFGDANVKIMQNLLSCLSFNLMDLNWNPLWLHFIFQKRERQLITPLKKICGHIPSGKIKFYLSQSCCAI